METRKRSGDAKDDEPRKRQNRVKKEGLSEDQLDEAECFQRDGDYEMVGM